jgi:preprotein translocase subunit SecE
MEEMKKVGGGDFVGNGGAKKQDAKKSKPKNKKPGFFSRIVAKLKDVFSELKKVNWPSFGKVVKQTGIVLAVVLVFLVVITAFDTGLTELLKLISF